MTLQSKRKITYITRFLLSATLLIVASVAAAQTPTNKLESTGNAGAGTTSPDRKLESLDSASPQMRLTHTDGSVYTDFQTIGSGHLLISPTGPDITGTKPFTVAADSDAFRFYPNADTNLRWSLSTDASGIFHVVQKGDSWVSEGTRLSINRSGNVGIGTLSPQARLHVQRDTNGDASLYLLNADTGSNSRSVFLLGEANSDARYGYLGYFGANYTGWANSTVLTGAGAGGLRLYSFGGLGQTGGAITFNTAPVGNNSGVAERMRIEASGNVGIGVAPSSSYKLDVAGQVRSSSGGFVFPDGTVQTTAASGNGGSSQWSGTSGNPIYYNGGNVGIGTPTNPTHKLTVGSGTTTSVNAAFAIVATSPTTNTGIAAVADTQDSVFLYADTTNNVFGLNAFDYGSSVYRDVTVGWGGKNVLLARDGGNIGIGTTTPGAKLDVGAGATPRGGNSDILVGAGGNVPQIELYHPNKSAAVSYDGTNLSFYTNGPSWSQAMVVDNSGNVGMGTTTSLAEKLEINGNLKLSGTGNLNATGTIEANNIKAKYQDLAEWVPSSEQLAAGTVVVLDTTKSNQVISSTVSYDTRVAGVISAQPGITLGEGGEGKVMVATTGRVRVKVDASRGPIQIGDLLVTSDVTGVAMKSEAVEFAGRKMHMPGTIIGKALEPLAKGSGEILVLLSLQ